ncbi:MAG: beta-N-acetylhexosaminidase [Rhodospirillaceae bacterium]|nr:beta-N-acetylhexosaminidase [Rhodospirillaceae bacterium]
MSAPDPVAGSVVDSVLDSVADPSSPRPAPVVFGLAGTALSAPERPFFAEADPLGFILFARNCETPGQVRALVEDLRDLVGRADAPVLIDQEGGRVARLGPPHWRRSPAAWNFVELARRAPESGVEAARLNARLMACELAALGIDVDCAPVLDVRQADAHEVIGDRAHGDDPNIVSALGRAVAEGLLAGGVLPVIKHVPGHGRARADSHLELPRVDTPRRDLAAIDFAPFAALADMPWAMTAHVLYAALDSERPATTSAKVIAEVIRGEIGFDGVLVSDDLGMKALGGPLGARGADALTAGCDLALHCSGKMDEMLAVRAALPAMTTACAERLARGRAALASPPDPVEPAALAARLDTLLGRA